MMQHIFSNQVNDLGKIFDENIELVSVDRPRSGELESLADKLFLKRTVLELDWQQETRDEALPQKKLATLKQEEFTPLASEITHVTKLLLQLFNWEVVRVRVTTISGPMCPKFHTDYVPCRMLITVSGPSTEWIASQDVQEEILADQKSAALPIKEGKKIRQLASGSLSLLKGGNWQDGFRGVVHRSPHTKAQRLLLTFDPIL